MTNNIDSQFEDEDQPSSSDDTDDDSPDSGELYDSSLDVEWQKQAKIINAKIKAGVDSIKEAVALAKKNGVPYFNYDEYSNEEDLSEEDQEKLDQKLEDIDYHQILGAIDAAGWRSSSVGC